MDPVLPQNTTALPTLRRFVWQALRTRKVWAMTVFCVGCAGFCGPVMWPLFLKSATDVFINFTQGQQIDWSLLWPVIPIGVVGTLSFSVPPAVAEVLAVRGLAVIRSDLRRKIMSGLYAQAPQFYQERFVGTISTNVRDLSESVSDIVNETLTQFAPSIFYLLLYGTILATLHPGYLLILFAWASLRITIMVKTHGKTQKKSKAYADSRSILVGKIVDSLTNHMAVRSFAAIGNEARLLETAEQHTIATRVDSIYYSRLVLLGGLLIGPFFLIGGMFGFFIYLFEHGQANVSDIVFLLPSMANFMFNVGNLMGRVLYIYEQVGTGQDAIGKIMLPQTINDHFGATDLVVSQGAITIKNLNFAYDTGKICVA